MAHSTYCQCLASKWSALTSPARAASREPVTLCLVTFTLFGEHTWFPHRQPRSARTSVPLEAALNQCWTRIWRLNSTPVPCPSVAMTLKAHSALRSPQQDWAPVAQALSGLIYTLYRLPRLSNPHLPAFSGTTSQRHTLPSDPCLRVSFRENQAKAALQTR